MNLLSDSWLDIHTHQLDKQKIIIYDISRADIVDLYAPRADFKGALYQLLIGLLQTAFAPEDKRAWIKYWRQPPTQAELASAFAQYEKAFDLDTDNGKPAFMQDLELAAGSSNNISGLFIEAPGDNTLKNNQAHFIKEGTFNQVSAYWAAVALFTLQINAPSGGQGHRVSLRGGGPLTTLLLPPDEPEGFNSLWHRLWLNILTQDEMFDLRGNSGLDDLAAIFPWMGKTRTSKNTGSETLPQHGHPLQMYWSMPRRIRLDWLSETGICDVSGEASDTLVRTYRAENYGVNYAGTWMHPLTPYVVETGKEPYSIKAQPGGLGYRHWLELAAVNEDGNRKRYSAFIVQTQRQERQGWIKNSFGLRLWAFGYDMDNMKARCWYEATMPLYDIDPTSYEDLQHVVKLMIKAATDTLHAVKNAIKIAWFQNPKDDQNAKKFNERAIAIDANFWAGTESQFYQLLEPLVTAINASDDEHIPHILSQWRIILKDFAFKLFDDYAMTSANEDGDLKRVIKARHGKAANKTEKEGKQKKGNGLGYFINVALKSLAA